MNKIRKVVFYKLFPFLKTVTASQLIASKWKFIIYEIANQGFFKVCFVFISSAVSYFWYTLLILINKLRIRK